MKKFIVETYYTCTFKTVHSLNDLNDKELSKIDDRNDGTVELIDVKLNNRKTEESITDIIEIFLLMKTVQEHFIRITIKKNILLYGKLLIKIH